MASTPRHQILAKDWHCLVRLSIHKNDHNRSIPLHELMPLFQITCEWHSLQKEYRAADLSALAGSAEAVEIRSTVGFLETVALSNVWI